MPRMREGRASDEEGRRSCLRGAGGLAGGSPPNRRPDTLVQHKGVLLGIQAVLALLSSTSHTPEASKQPSIMKCELYYAAFDRDQAAAS